MVLLDNPLSALDAMVAAYVFRACIKGFMREKKVFFVTNDCMVLTCHMVAPPLY